MISVQFSVDCATYLGYLLHSVWELYSLRNDVHIFNTHKIFNKWVKFNTMIIKHISPNGYVLWYLHYITSQYLLQ